MDRADRRGRAWASVTEQDWDADLHPEVVVGLPDQSWVLDPVEGGTLHYYDDKPALWAVADVMARRPEPYHQFVDPSPAYDAHSHRWLTERLVPAHLPPEGMLTSIDQDLAPLPRLPYRLESSEQGRGAVTIELVGEPGDGSVRKRLRASGRRLSVTYELTGLPAGRFGSTLPVSVEEGAGSIRVDGGEWTGTDRLARLSGHRFRFQHRARQQEVLVVSRIPCHLYVIPIRTWVTTRRALDQIMQGVVLWPHWLIEGQGTYELDIEIGDGGT